MQCNADCRAVVLHNAVEGKFYRYKTANHPHTNMAKAALNMMTRTSAQDYRSSNIFMTYAAIPSFQLLCKFVQGYLQDLRSLGFGRSSC